MIAEQLVTCIENWVPTEDWNQQRYTDVMAILDKKLDSDRIIIDEAV